MKFYELVKELQKINKNKIVLVKNGIFFNCIGRDAIVLGKVFDLKRTCFGKGVCKVGIPVNYVRENILKIKEKLGKNNLGIIIYDEMEGGNFIFNDKKYGILFEMEGNNIEEERKNTNCSKCEDNVFYIKEQRKELKNKKIENEIKKEYTLKKEDYNFIIEILENVLNTFRDKAKLENNNSEKDNKK